MQVLVGMVIHWKLYKRIEFDYTKNWYLHKQEFVQEQETPNILRDFGIQKDPQILAKNRPSVYKKRINEFCASNIPKWKKQRKWKDKQIPSSCQKLLNIRKVVVIRIVVGALETVTKFR